MKAEPVRPARIDFTGDAPSAPDFGDVYHPREGALAQARHVFLRGNQLPERWRGRERFALLELGFGLGGNFVATWAAWRDDPQRCRRLHFVSIERHPPLAQDLRRIAAASPLPALVQALAERWPPLTPNLHRLSFDDGAVELLLLFADVGAALREVVGRFDAFFLDGFAPAKNPAMWQPSVFASLARLAAPAATAATWSVAREVRDGLAAAGFAVERAPGFGGKREMTPATFAPRHTPSPPAGRPAPLAARDVAIVGAGLAGCAAAAALVDAGLDVRMIEQIGAGSAQRAGLFHGVVHRDDAPHARFGRAAALLAATELADAIQRHAVPGRPDGVLRLAAARHDHAALLDIVRVQALPAQYVQALDAAQASTLAGLPIDTPAWFYAGGGWIDPRALCAAWLAHAGVTPHAASVAALRRDDARWHLLDASGHVIASASIVVLAGGATGGELLRTLAALPLSIVRGQALRVAAGTPGLHPPALPIADAGYALALADGSVLCGATSQAGDISLDPRADDRTANLQRLHRLTGSRIDEAATGLTDSVGLRLAATDRLPLIGPLPGSLPAKARLDQPRLVPRAPGLYAFSALGSRGITWAPLGARLLAAQIAGAPWPLEADLADAVDPARFVARAVRTSAS